MPPSTAPASPPDLASLYVQLHQQDRSANQIDRGLAMMASAFGTQQQQHDMLNYAQNLQPDDRGAMLGNIIKDQAAQTQLQEHNRFVAGAAGMATMLGVTPAQASWLAQNPDAMNDALKTHFENLSKTDLQKNLDAGAVAYKQANPNATDEEVAQWKSNMINLTVNPAAKEAATVQARESQEFKDSAISEYSAVSNKLADQASTVKQLLDNLPATVSAIKDPLPTSGMGANLNPFMSQATKNQAVLIQKLKAGLTGESLQSVKNVRNIREFNTLGEAVTAGLNSANSPDQIKASLEAIQNKILDAQAAAEAAAGHHLSGNLANRPATQDLLSPTLNGRPNPYYTGATQDPPAQQGGSSGGGTHYVYDPKTGTLQ